MKKRYSKHSNHPGHSVIGCFIEGIAYAKAVLPFEEIVYDKSNSDSRRLAARAKCGVEFMAAKLYLKGARASYKTAHRMGEIYGRLAPKFSPI